jgi:hypothetical protein
VDVDANVVVDVDDYVHDHDHVHDHDGFGQTSSIGPSAVVNGLFMREP